MTDANETQIGDETHASTQKSQFKEQRFLLRYDSGQHQYDEEGELLTVLLVERHQTLVSVQACVRADATSADNVHAHSSKPEVTLLIWRASA